MPFKKGQKANPLGALAHKDKPFRQALRAAIAQSKPERLRNIAEALLNAAESGDLQSIKEVADRLDGKPAQESTITHEKHDITRWTRAELVAFLDSGPEEGGSPGTAAKGRRSGEPDSLH